MKLNLNLNLKLFVYLYILVFAGTFASAQTRQKTAEELQNEIVETATRIGVRTGNIGKQTDRIGEILRQGARDRAAIPIQNMDTRFERTLLFAERRRLIDNEQSAEVVKAMFNFDVAVLAGRAKRAPLDSERVQKTLGELLKAIGNDINLVGPASGANPERFKMDSAIQYFKDTFMIKAESDPKANDLSVPEIRYRHADREIHRHLVGVARTALKEQGNTTTQKLETLFQPRRPEADGRQ